MEKGPRTERTHNNIRSVSRKVVDSDAILDHIPSSLKFFFLFLFTDLRESEREEKKHHFVVPLICAFIGSFFLCSLTGDQTCNLGILAQHSTQLSFPSRDIPAS